MAKSKGGGGNKFTRQVKNQERIGAGKVETVKEILQRGPNTPEKVVQQIKDKKAEQEKEK